MEEYPMPEATLPELIEASRGGNLDAFSTIVRRLDGEVRGFVALMAVAPDWIDDVMQDVFIELFRSLHSYDSGQPFIRWVRGVARNVIRRHREDQLREARLRSGAVSELIRRRSLSRADNEAPSPGLDALAACLERLPENLRRLVELRYAGEHSSEEIAALTGRRPEAVRVTLLRSRQQLLNCIRSVMETGGGGP